MSSLHRLFSRLALAAVVTASAATVAQAADAPAQPQPQAQQHQQQHPQRFHPQHRMQKHAPNHQEQLERMKILLQLQPKQQAAWDAYVAAMQPPAQPQTTASPSKKEMSTLERLDWQASMRQQRNAHIEQREQATRKFYKSLNAQQQQAFDTLPRAGAGRGMHKKGMRMHKGQPT